MKSTTQRSLKLLRSRGYRPHVDEHYNVYSRKRHDKYGFIDISAIHPDIPGELGVQTTTKSHLANRINKAKLIEEFWMWLNCNNPVEFHGWYKDKQGLWQVKIVAFDANTIFD